MKGKIKADHIPVNKFQLIVLGLPTITFVTVSGLEDELQVVDLPDRTKGTGGNRLPVEFTASIPMHHTEEVAAMELWYAETQDPVSPTMKKVGTLLFISGTGNTIRSYTLDGIFPSKRGLPELDMNNEGEMAAQEWTFQVDNMLPI